LDNLMQAEDLILVTGATGNTGAALLQQLEACGTRVRAMVRSHKDGARLYFQGLLAFQSMIATEGHFVAPIGDARVSAVDVRDIAAVATRALTESGHEGKTYTITGPAAVTHTEMASAIAEAIGRPVTFIDVSSDTFAGALNAAGVPAWQVDGLVEDYAHYARGEAETISPHVRDVTGADQRDMGEFAKDYARAFVGA
jgi:uncharacterized protein YbjT (DUF2867 family)